MSSEPKQTAQADNNVLNSGQKKSEEQENNKDLVSQQQNDSNTNLVNQNYDENKENEDKSQSNDVENEKQSNNSNDQIIEQKTKDTTKNPTAPAVQETEQKNGTHTKKTEDILKIPLSKGQENGQADTNDRNVSPSKSGHRKSNLSNINGSTPLNQVKRRGQGSSYLDPMQLQNELKKRQNIHWRKRLQKFVGSKSFDIFIIVLVIIYTILVFILFALDNDENSDNSEIQTVISVVQYIEMVILIIFILEIWLKVIAVGAKEYFRDSWLVFDAIVILASVVLLILDFTLNNSQFSTISKILRGIFRFLRLFLVFRKVNQLKKNAIAHSRFATKTPVEAILEIMGKLKDNVDDLKFIQEIDYAIEMISDNRLYEPIVMKGDKDAENWIGTYANTKKVTSNTQNEKDKKGAQIQTDSNNISTNQQKSQTDLFVNEIQLHPAMQKYIDKIDTLDFEVFNLHQEMQGNEMAHLLVYLFNRYNIFSQMKIQPSVLFDFGNRIASGYLDNHYHNKIHGFDVTQTVHFFMSTCDFINVGQLSPLEITTMYVASACHDYQHGGMNNVFLINTRDQLAIRYNDKSPLENHHVSQTFFILKEENNKYNFTKNFSKDDFKKFRERMISMILATDMQHHFADQAKLKGRLAAEFDPKEKDKPLCMETILHAADVSNPIKPFQLYDLWATRVLNEFWDQGDRERELGLNITYLCDRYTVNKSKSQMGFIDFIVKPYYETIKHKSFLPQLEQYTANFETNKEEWKKQVEHWDQQLATLNQEKQEQEKEQQNSGNPTGVSIKK